MEEIAILNFKATKELREAIRRVAFKKGHSNKSKAMIEILSENEMVETELRKIRAENKRLQHSIKNKVEAS